MAQDAKPPVGQLGHVIEGGSFSGLFGDTYDWTSLMRSVEETPEFKWPQSVRSLRLMMNDSQIAALYAMSTLQIRGFKYFINPNGCDEKIVRHVAADLGLPIKGEDDSVKKSATLGFKFKRHLYHALKALSLGHMYFELGGEILEDGKWHLHRLGLRPSESIVGFKLNRDGMLESIRQRDSSGGNWMGTVDLPVNRLLAYLHDAEDGDWVGRAITRPCYGDFLIKDRVKRVNAINIERGGGIPWIKNSTERSGRQMQALAQVAADFKAHEDGGAAIPEGSEIVVEKTSAPDAINTIRYHDESMARAFLAMFAMLGQTQSGSRALGSTFVDFFALGQESIADDLVGEPFNEYVIRRLVEWNYGPQESLPLLDYERPEGILPVADLVALVEQGLIVVDDEVRGWLSQAYNLPRQEIPEETPQAASFAYDLDSGVVTIDERRAQLGLPPREDGQGNLTVPEFLKQFGGTSEGAVKPEEENPDDAPIEVPPAEAKTSWRDRLKRRSAASDDWPFRRQMKSWEASAGLDPVRLKDDHESALADLLGVYQDEIKPELIDDLTTRIKDADGDAAEIAKIAADPKNASKLKARIKQVWEDGHESHRAEAKAQGVEIDAGDAEDADAGNRASALGGLLAAGIGVSAMTKALSLTGTGLTPSNVAEQVAAYLSDLTDSSAEKNIRGAVTRAYNGGRISAVKTALATKAGTVYASELLDENTCSACAEVDGQEYDSIEDAEADYPAGPFVGCEGGDYCRGTVVVVYD